MKLKLTLVATIVASLGIFAAPAAQASCTELVDDVCAETVVCKALSKFDCVE